jgi:mono/diheme cytochrome c family protein
MTRSQIEITLGLLLVLISATVLLFIGIREEDRMAEREAEVAGEAIEVGADMFESNCSPCHGEQGRGVAGLAPALNDDIFFTDRLREVGWAGTMEDYIISTISAGRRVSTRPDQYVGAGVPAMAAWSEEFGGPLRYDQIRDVTQYIVNWQGAAVAGVVVEPLDFSTPIPVDDPVARGLAVYEKYSCGACHIITGISEGVVGPNQTNIGAVAETRVAGQSAEDYIRESILAPNAYVVEGFTEGIMPQNYADLMTEVEIIDLVAFLLDQK